MSADILIYRAIRLWKVVALGVAVPLATVWAVTSGQPTDAPVLLLLALVVPVFHALRYPGMWQETLAVALILALCLWLASMMGESLSTGAVIWRVFWLGVMALILFFMAVTPASLLALVGPKRVLTARASRRSSLGAEALRAAITLYPGQTGARTVCGPADKAGRFPVTLQLGEFEGLKYEMVDCLDVVDDEEEAFEDDDGAGLGACGFEAVVHSTGPDHHEVFTFENADEVCVQRHGFAPLAGGGTWVTVEETGTALTLGQIFGFWLIDHMADYLTHDIDLAEGRAPRANRAFPQKQLVVDIANLILPWMGGQRIESPES